MKGDTDMERPVRRWRFLNSLAGRLMAAVTLIVILLIIRDILVQVQLIHIRDAIVEIAASSRYLETVLTAGQLTENLVATIYHELSEKNLPDQAIRAIAPTLVTLEVQRTALRETAEALPPGSLLRQRMAVVAAVLGNVTDKARQIIRFIDRGDWDLAEYTLRELDVNYRLVEQESDRLVVMVRERHQQAQAETRAAIRRIVLITPLVASLVLLAMAVSSVAILRGVVTGIRLLYRSARQLAEGHLEERIPLQGLEEFRSLARTFNTMAAELQQLYTGLERLVAERTAQLARRTTQLEAAAYVARRAAEIRDLDTLLNETVRLISDRFGFYHAGIFLVDDAGEYAVLRAASSEGGQRMLARGHRMAVGKVGIVGTVAGAGKPRIALDVGADAVFFDNPDLPLTRSEMAVPLKVEERVIGVLDVQSVEPEAFTDEDVAVLQTMADQIALAIENARLLEESRRALEELERLYGERAREAWRMVASSRPTVYRYTGIDVEPFPAPVPLAGEEDGRRLAVPIRLWGQTIGTILLQRMEEQPAWSPEERRLAEEIGEQIALALENARLIAETESRAARERLLSEMTSRLTRSLDMDALLDTAVRELARLPEVSEVAVYVGGQEELAPATGRRRR